VKFNIPDLTPEECGDIAITAAEGGTGYWCQIDEYRPSRWLVDDAADPDGEEPLGHLAVPDDFVFYRIAPLDPAETGWEWDKAQAVTPAWIRTGFTRALAAPRDKGGWAVQDLLSVAREDWTGEIDADCADLIFQFAFYGEVVWG
jgi:hypothetical protein